MSNTPDIRVRAAEAEKLTLKTGARLAGLPVSTWLRILGLNEAKRLIREALKSEVK
jgi:hypothetical protein